MPTPAPLVEADPFELPAWLGTAEVTWRAGAAVRDGHLVPGRLLGVGETDHPCDLLAVDEAHPVAVADDETRRASHLAWRHGQVHLLTRGGRLTLARPGTDFTADDALDAIERLARAVGADPAHWSVLLGLSGHR